MNQDQVKEQLLKIDGDVEDFAVIFSGKNSKKVDGLYHPEKQEMIIHNKNFSDDNTLMYTAIHEFAHHIQFTRHKAEVTSRAHTTLYWNIFHQLLEVAEQQEIYINLFEEDENFRSLTKQIKSQFMSTNGELMKEFGKLLIKALDLCQQKHAIFEDYVDRALGLNRTAAKSIMKVYAMDVDSEIGFDNMKIVAGIREPKQRREAEESFRQGKSQDMVKASIKEFQPKQEPTLKRLESQKKRLEKNMQNLQMKITDLEMQIEDFNDPGENEE